jgi:hypothetical protein
MAKRKMMAPRRGEVWRLSGRRYAVVEDRYANGRTFIALIDGKQTFLNIEDFRDAELVS